MKMIISVLFLFVVQAASFSARAWTGPISGPELLQQLIKRYGRNDLEGRAYFPKSSDTARGCQVVLKSAPEPEVEFLLGRGADSRKVIYRLIELNSKMTVVSETKKSGDGDEYLFRINGYPSLLVKRHGDFEEITSRIDGSGSRDFTCIVPLR